MMRSLAIEAPNKSPDKSPSPIHQLLTPHHLTTKSPLYNPQVIGCPCGLLRTAFLSCPKLPLVPAGQTARLEEKMLWATETWFETPPLALGSGPRRPFSTCQPPLGTLISHEQLPLGVILLGPF